MCVKRVSNKISNKLSVCLCAALHWSSVWSFIYYVTLGNLDFGPIHSKAVDGMLGNRTFCTAGMSNVRVWSVCL